VLQLCSDFLLSVVIHYRSVKFSDSRCQSDNWNTQVIQLAALTYILSTLWMHVWRFLLMTSCYKLLILIDRPETRADPPPPFPPHLICPFMRSSKPSKSFFQSARSVVSRVLCFPGIRHGGQVPPHVLAMQEHTSKCRLKSSLHDKLNATQRSFK